MMNISVIIPVYNAERFLEKAALSALQFEEVKEVLLIEDKSPDNSLAVCQKLVHQHHRVKLFQHPDKGNYGAGASRNLGLEKATQEFIAFLDADDYYLPNRFDAEKKLFQNQKIEGVFGAIGTEFITEKGKKQFEEKFRNNTLNTVNYEAEGMDIFMGFYGDQKFLGAFFHLNTLTVRKFALDREKLRFNEKLRVHQDSDFITKLMYHCYLHTGIITEAIAIRGVHDDNRITDIKSYSKDFYRKQFLLAESRYNWAKQQKDIPREAFRNFKLNYDTFRLSHKKGILKYIGFAISALQNKKLLRATYRFHALNTPK